MEILNTLFIYLGALAFDFADWKFLLIAYRYTFDVPMTPCSCWLNLHAARERLVQSLWDQETPGTETYHNWTGRGFVGEFGFGGSVVWPLGISHERDSDQGICPKNIQKYSRKPTAETSWWWRLLHSNFFFLSFLMLIWPLHHVQVLQNVLLHGTRWVEPGQ